MPGAKVDHYLVEIFLVCRGRASLMSLIYQQSQGYNNTGNGGQLLKFQKVIVQKRLPPTEIKVIENMVGVSITTIAAVTNTLCSSTGNDS